MTKRTFKIESTATATVVVDYEDFQKDMAQARLLCAEGQRTKIHPMTSMMIEDGYSDEVILEAIVRSATTTLLRDEMRDNSDAKSGFYFKGIQVTTKCESKK